MWQNVKFVIASFCILIYIAAAAFAGIKIYQAVNEQRFEAQQEFADLTDLASRAGALGFFTNDYIKDIKTRLDMSDALDALIIYGSDNNKFAFEKKAGLISYNGDYPDFNRKVRLYRAPQSAPIRTESNLNVSISAISPLIDFSKLLSVLRSSMIAILAALCVAFATLIADVCMVNPASGLKSAAKSAGNAGADDRRIIRDEPDAAETKDPAESMALFDDFFTEAPGGGEADLAGEPASANETRPDRTPDAGGDEPDAGETKGPAESMALFDDFFTEAPGGGEADLAGTTGPADETRPDRTPDAGGDEPGAGETKGPAESMALFDDSFTEAPGGGEADLAGTTGSADETRPDRTPDAGGDEPGGGEADLAGTTGTADETRPDRTPDTGGENLRQSKKDTSGLGLLAAANAMYETDNFDSRGEGPEFSDILQDELDRAEANGKDIVLLNIEWTTPGLPCKPLIKQASSVFMHGSRFFEKYRQEGLYIIVPDSNLEEVFAKVKEFHRYAREKKPPEVYAELLIGMTARSLRSVYAMNFLNEAEQALDKARLDSALPIVAFKVDPQKYNEYARRLGSRGSHNTP
ncbi:MAG: hypothetical protein LBD86_07630 [Spirochaetaceae bacterium]|jgi:hypothetical protein|nr:hypothetical protein [Spirochaetaceae bacterium]